LENDMSNKALVILGILAAVMAVWALVQSNVQLERGAKLSANAPLIPGLNTDDISSITVKSSESTVTLVRDGAKFVLADKNNYPTQNSTVNNLITSALDIKTAELITSDKTNFAELGVGEDKAKTIITFYKADKSVLAGVIVGNNAQGGRGCYVRLVGGKDVFLSSSQPWFQSGAMDYVDKNVIGLNEKEVASIAVKTKAGSYTLTKDANDKVIASGIDLPAGKKMKEDAASGAFSEPISVAIEDVMPASEAKFDFGRSIAIKMKDPTVYTVEVADANGKTYIKVSAEYTDKSDVTKDTKVESPEVLKGKEAKLLARDKADNFNKKHIAWVYEVGESKGKGLAKNPAEFLEDIPKPAADVNMPAEANVPGAAESI
jgi:hypothetical protein